MGGKKKLKTPNLFLAARPQPLRRPTSLTISDGSGGLVGGGLSWNRSIGGVSEICDGERSPPLVFLFLDFRFFFWVAEMCTILIDFMIFVEVVDFNGRMMYYNASIHFKWFSFLIEIIWLIVDLISESIVCGTPYLLNLGEDINTPFFCCVLA